MTRLRLFAHVLLALAALTAFVAAPARAAPSDLDRSFGGGEVITSFGRADASVAVTLDGDGNVVAAGITGDDFAVARYTQAGALDGSFGAGGKVTTSIGPGADVVGDVAMQLDKIVVAGTTMGATSDFSIARYNPDGSLDASFGSGGITTTDIEGGPDTAVAVLPQSNGDLTLVGSSKNGHVTLARYVTTGGLDATFSDDGLVFADFGDGVGGALAAAEQSDGKLLVAGYAETASGDLGVGLMRFLSGGDLDDTFGSGGVVVTAHAGASATPLGVATQDDGKIVVVGGASTEDGEALLVSRYTPAGALDTGFGTEGSRVTPVDGAFAQLESVVVTQADHILAVGTICPSASDCVFASARYSASGAPDPESGLRTYEVGTADAAAHDVVLDSSGRAVVAGEVAASPEDEGDTVDFALVRLLDSATPPVRFVPADPRRILDTRDAGSEIPGPIGEDARADVQVAGRGSVPASGASAVVLNVTATQGTAPGYLTVYPKGAARPVASNLNFRPGQDVPNLVTVQLGAGGKVSVYNALGSTHVVIDVAGWYAPVTGFAGLYSPVVPGRVTDTRLGAGNPLGPNATMTIQPTGVHGVPSTGAAAVALNVTAVDPTASSYLTVWPAETEKPLASNLNFEPGQTVPNRVIVKTGADGRVSIFNYTGRVHVVVDVGGWFTSDTPATGAGAFTPLVPRRILDTRLATEDARVTAGEPRFVDVAGLGGVPATGATAVVLNVTVTEPTESSWLTLYPSDAGQPHASDLNFVPGQSVPNLVLVKLGSNGKVAVSNAHGAAHVIFDVAGWYG